MDRRQFFRNATLIAAGTVAADQLELLERLTWKRRCFPSAALSSRDTQVILLSTVDPYNRKLISVVRYELNPIARS